MGPHWFSCVFSVFLYVDTTKHRCVLFPHFVFFLFLLKGQPRIQSVLHFAFSLPVSSRSFHFCTERASSFFLHCILFCGWAILYLTSPQNIGVVSKLLLLQTTYHGQPGPGPVLHCARVSGKLWSRAWWWQIVPQWGFTSAHLDHLGKSTHRPTTDRHACCLMVGFLPIVGEKWIVFRIILICIFLSRSLSIFHMSEPFLY